MATYKVIQDIEAEDKLLGPLTFRQFVYAGLAVINFYITFLVITKGAGFMAVIFFPTGLVAGFFAWPWSRDQPTEIWALAKIRFLVKPRKRIWDQSGVKELVTITAPKKIEAVYTNGLSETEVQSRLRALAETIDSRGWAIKNVNVNMFNPTYNGEPDSDRLVSANSLPQPVPDVDIQPSEDMMEENNPVARQFDTMIAASTKARRQDILQQMRTASVPVPQAPVAQAAVPAGNPGQQQPPANYWFLNQPSLASASAPQNAVTFNTQLVTPGKVVPGVVAAPVAATPTVEEEALIKKLEAEDQRLNSVNTYNHWHIIQPLSEQQQAQKAARGQTQPIAPRPYAAPQAQNQSTTQPQIGSSTNDTAQVQNTGQQPVQTPATDNGQAGLQQQPVWQPPAEFLAQEAAARAAQAQVTPATDPAILRLATNDDLNVATLAREANKRREELQDEVVISLH